MNGMMRQGHSHSHNMRRRGRGHHRKPNQGRNQTFDSNGPSVRLRGSAHQIYEKYLALGRDASAGGDRIMAENFFQHADHYFRIILANAGPNEQFGERGQFDGGGAVEANGYDQQPFDTSSGDSQGQQPPYGAPGGSASAGLAGPSDESAPQGQAQQQQQHGHQGGYRQGRDRFHRRFRDRGERGQQGGQGSQQGDGREGRDAREGRNDGNYQPRQQQHQNQQQQRRSDDDRFEPPAFLRVDRPNDPPRDPDDEQQ
ncbi:MAG: DUF4167 domain-containing protein [Burkholderiales bacterium]